MRRWLRGIEWAAIVGSALALAFGMLVIVPATLLHQPSTLARSGCITHECREDMAADTLARYTEILALFTGVLAIASIAQGYFLIRAERLTRSSVEIARNESIASHRAWLSIRDLKITSMHLVVGPQVNRSSLWIEATFNIRNSGSSPALNCNVSRKMWIVSPNISPADEITEIRRQVRTNMEAQQGEAIAPDSVSDQRINFSIADVDATEPPPGELQFHTVQISIALAYSDPVANSVRETVASFWVLDPRPDATIQGLQYSAIRIANGAVQTSVRRVGNSTMI